MRSAAAAARAGSDRRRARARRRDAERSDAHRRRGPDGGPSALPGSSPAPTRQPPGPARRAPRAPDGAQGRGVPAGSAPAALGGAAAPGRAAAGRLLGGGSRYAQSRPRLPGSPRLLTASLSAFRAPLTACRSGGRRPALHWLHVLSLTCASAPLAGRGAEGRLGTRVRAFGASRAAGGPGDTVGGRGPQHKAVSTLPSNARSRETQQSNIPGTFRQRKEGGRKRKGDLSALRWGEG